MIKHDLIYDVGMNNGDDTAYYLHKGFKVLAIEADPDLCSKAAERFAKDIQEDRIKILNIGIAAEQGTFDFWICETLSAWNSFDRSVASREGLPHHSIPVPCLTFESILKDHGVPYYLKVDIEGNDILCIEALPKGGDLPEYVSVELGSIERLTELLDARGYGGYKVISQLNFLPLELPPAKEAVRYERFQNLLASQNLIVRGVNTIWGRAQRFKNLQRRCRKRGNWVFQPGSSGSFGEDTLGMWYDLRKVRDTYQHYWHLFKTGKHTPFWSDKEYFWVDLHARRTQ